MLKHSIKGCRRHAQLPAQFGQAHRPVGRFNQLQHFT